MDSNVNAISSDEKQSSQDEIQIIPVEKKSDDNDVKVVLEYKRYPSKNSCQDEHKLKVLRLINSFLGLSPTQVIDDDSLMTGKSLLSWLKEWFPKLEPEFLQGISESQAVRNCHASLADLYNSIATGPLGDHSISIESSTDLNSIMSGNGITSRFPYVRCRLNPDSLVSEQQRQNTFEKANLSDMLLDNLYRYAESFYLKRCHVDASLVASHNCNHSRLSDTHVIERIDFIAHPKLFSDYEEEVEKFKRQNKSVNEKLLFHGTHATNLNKILDDNFKITADPVSRKKVNMYGEGIYFSDFPAKSLRYGEALLLCKVILGTEEVVQLGCKPTTSDEYFHQNFNSRKMVNSLERKDGPANIYMTPNPHQILPCYVLYLKKKGTKNDKDVAKVPFCASSIHFQPFSHQILLSPSKAKTISLGANNRPDNDTIFPIAPYLEKVEAQYEYERNRFLNSLNMKNCGTIESSFYSIGVERLVLRYIKHDWYMSSKLKTLNPRVMDMKKIVSSLCKDKTPSRRDLRKLENFIPKQSIALAIYETFFSAPSKQNLNGNGVNKTHTSSTDSQSSRTNKRTHSQVDATDNELWRLYREKLSKFGNCLDSYTGEQVCAICIELIKKYKGIESIENKRNKPASKSKKTVIKFENSVFETKGCNHQFHLECAKQILSSQPSDQYFECPECRTIQGVKMGNQPDTGVMTVTKESFDLPGYKKSWSLTRDESGGNTMYTSSFAQPNGTWVVEYKFKDGTQNSTHPNPGSPFYAHSFPRKAYFPNTPEGIKIVGMLRLAFDRKLVFTVGKSATTGRDNVIVWNGIHHKTKIADSTYGYPDPTYLQRVEHELNAFGITEKDLHVAGNNKI